MRMLRRVLLGLVVLVAAAVVVAFFLPREITVERTADVAAPAEIVFPLISDLRRYNEWSPWAGLDPRMEQTFTGASEGVGQKMNWSSADPRVGSGSQEIVRIDPGRRVDLALEVSGQGKSEAWTAVEPKGRQTAVTWGLTTDLGLNPVARYFGLFLDGMVGPDFERGLARLREVAEAEAKAVAGGDGPTATTAPGGGSGPR